MAKVAITTLPSPFQFSLPTRFSPAIPVVIRTFIPYQLLSLKGAAWPGQAFPASFLSRLAPLGRQRDYTLHTLDGRYRPSRESTLSGWLVWAIKRVYTLLRVGISHRESLHSLDGRYRPFRDSTLS
ncbi:hypothetical protein PCANC_21950 [Puccinia coronata f. sp. avenae]|uniref:Uncharacterized protein n=1 Tax=Puccinia coronata f. sp. avenae TaxID=200324 RepID=A0A2N5U5N5_9BASI|nr:hypothetical protein PCANC_21950 [Puccinia coronata f. sp. avenae]